MQYINGIDNRNIVRIEINEKHNKWNHSSADDSFYAEINNSTRSINERCSFHYPVLERWLQMAMKRFQDKKSKYNPLIGQNIAFVFHDKNTEGTTNAIVSAKLMEGAQKLFKSSNNFIVTIYDWDLDVLSADEIKIIFRNINTSFTGKDFYDPLANTEHKATVTPIKAILKQYNNQLKENQRNMKKVIRLTESDLSNIISQVLNEAYPTMSKSDLAQSYDYDPWSQTPQGASLSKETNYGWDGGLADFVDAWHQFYHRAHDINISGNTDHLYTSKIVSKVDELSKVIELFLKRERMNRGLPPNGFPNNEV